MSFYNWQIEKYGNVIGLDGVLHADTHHMVDDEKVQSTFEEFENGYSEAAIFAGKMDQHFELLLLNDCY